MKVVYRREVWTDEKEKEGERREKERENECTRGLKLGCKNFLSIVVLCGLYTGLGTLEQKRKGVENKIDMEAVMAGK
jgi:hypothetical protein